MSLYLDASALVPTLVNEERSSWVADILTRRAERLVISELAAAEVSSALGRLVRMSLLRQDAALGRLEMFEAWRAADTVNIEFQSSAFRMANLTVRRFELGLRTPDALHAAICHREELALVTLDKRLAVGARFLGLEVLVP